MVFVGVAKAAPIDNSETKSMKRSTLVFSTALCGCIFLAAPVRAAQLPTADAMKAPSSSEVVTPVAKPGQTCLSDVAAFNTQMEKDGYWQDSYGLGMGAGLGMGDGLRHGVPMDGERSASAAGYRNIRPGYEVRTLVAAATILARKGQQQPCEDVLATTRDVYKVYLADRNSGGTPMSDRPDRRLQQIATAQPVTGVSASFRSDELLGTNVFNLQNEALGSVDDLVMSPQSGKIAYLVIARGGFFGIDEKYVPVPWDDFKATAKMGMLVLDAPKSALDGAPQVSSDQFATTGNFDQESGKVDAYWKAQLSKDAKN